MRKLLFGLTAFAACSVSANATLIYFVDDNDKMLRTLDVNTATVNTIGFTGITGNFGDMAWDHTTGTMFLAGGRSDNNLYQLDLTTGTATLLGNHGVGDLFALGLDSAGNLVGQSSSGSVYTFNKGNGAATFVGSNSVYPGSLTWNSLTGQSLLLEAGGGRVYELNPDGSATFLAGGSFINDGGWDYDSLNDRYFAMDWSGDLFQYDSAFNRTTLGSGYGNVASMAIVPEPATMAALGLGLAVLARRRRSKK